MTFYGDVKHAFRQLRKSGAFTLSTIAVLAIGIGANTAVFSVVNTMLLKPLALPQPHRVVQLMRRNQRFNLYCIGVPDLVVWQAQTEVLEDVAGYSYVPEKLNLTSGSAPEQISADRVSRQYFRLFGARMAVGRTFTAEEDRSRAGKFAVISHGLWQRRFGSDRNLVGKSVLLGNEPYIIVGVLEVGFHGDREVDMWLPLHADPASQGVCLQENRRACNAFDHSCIVRTS